MTKFHHTIIGLPESGKTTFLAALWHLLNANEEATGLQLGRVEGDSTYLNSIVQAWRRCEKVPRTSIQKEEAHLSIHVCDGESGSNMVLTVPDLSGETFESQIIDRACSKYYVDGINGDGGLLLFVTANRANDGLTYHDMRGLLPVGGQAAVAKAWTIKSMPQQSQLVELLQFILRSPFARRRRKVGIIVSAWDVVENSLTPDAWLQREMPLLAQFLATNQESFHWQIWGVSAQGGDLNDSLRPALLRKLPSQRIRCVGADTGAHDLTAPLLWLNRSD